MAVDHSDEDILNGILGDLQRFVKRLGLPAHKHHLYDDIIQDTLIVVHRKWDNLKDLNADRRTGWVCIAMFNVTRNTARAELRRTDAWQRLADAFEHPEVLEYFDRADGNLTDALSSALNTLNPLDRKLLVDHIWAGHNHTELATANNLTETAVRHRLSRARHAARETALHKEI
jgi:RNA polymerase sigma factor (sigma-70 family)